MCIVIALYAQMQAQGGDQEGMMTRTLILASCALAGAMLTSAAYAGTIPPIEYDHPYKGHLEVIVAENAEQIRIGCPTTAGGTLGLACSLRYGNGERCTIV